MTKAIPSQLLIERLGADNESWRLDAEARLVALGDGAVAPLVAAAGHPEVSVRLHAVSALGRLQDARGLPAVIAALGDEQNRGAVAIVAERVLVAWGEAAQQALLEVALGGAPRARPRALRALGRMAAARGAIEAPLVRLLGDPLPGVRIQAAHALTRIAGFSAVEPVSQLLGDPDKWVRYEAAAALVSVGCARGEAVLRAALEDEEEQDTHLPGWAEELLEELEGL